MDQALTANIVSKKNQSYTSAPMKLRLEQMIDALHLRTSVIRID